MKKVSLILNLILFNLCFAGYTADEIFESIYYNNIQYFKKAIKSNAFNPNLHLDSTVGYSALIYAIIHDKEEIFDLLLQCKNIDVNQSSIGDRTFPLMFASLYKIKFKNENRDKYVEKLLKHPQININKTNVEKVSTLFCIITKNECHNLVPLFLDHAHIDLDMKCENKTIKDFIEILSKKKNIKTYQDIEKLILNKLKETKKQEQKNKENENIIVGN